MEGDCAYTRHVCMKFHAVLVIVSQSCLFICAQGNNDHVRYATYRDVKRCGKDAAQPHKPRIATPFDDR
jgi:hypothetical protein